MYLQLLLLHLFLHWIQFLRRPCLRFHSPQQIQGRRRGDQHSTKGHPEHMKERSDVMDDVR